MKINVNSIARKVEVDNRILLRNYYRIADNLLRQASIYREEKNVIDLYIILIRYSSLISETIPCHRDYQHLNPKERSPYKKRLIAVLDELESLKPEFRHLVDELNKAHAGIQLLERDDSERLSHGFEKSSLEWRRSSISTKSYLNGDIKRSANMASSSSRRYGSNPAHSSYPLQIDNQFQKLNLNVPLPKQETLSRHSFLGPDGLQSQWLGPSPQIKVQYPSNSELTSIGNSSLTPDGQHDIVTVRDGVPGDAGSAMESILSLDDGRWSHPADDLSSLLTNEAREDPFQFVSIRQPSPPPVLAQVQDLTAIPPSRVADPRPGPVKPCPDGMPSPNSYQHLHVAVNMMEDFLRLAQANTMNNLETCGVLAGSLKNKVFQITALIIPKQESTSDSCQTLNEEEIFEVQDRLSLFPLGWIHTHPSQTCFMSSVDLHTHYSYQIMLPEAIAIVMAPTDERSPHGIFHLSDPGGVSMIRNCQQRGFHPHEEPSDGHPLYEHCSHVYMNEKLKFDVIDLR